MYRYYRGKCESRISCCNALNRDGCSDVMMSCIGDNNNSYHLDDITITRDDYDDIVEYAHFIGVGFNYPDLVIIDD